MERRALLRGLLVAAPTVTAIAAGAAARSTLYIKETSELSLAALKKQVDELAKRMGRSEASNKKILKALLVLTALSLGIDASLLL